jgi:acyl-CoA dehydrogenase
MFHEQDLSEEQQMIRDVVVRLAGDFHNAYFLEHARAERFPAEFWKVLVENGFLGLEAPEEVGGSGCGLTDLVVFLYALGRGGLASYHLMGHLLAVHLLVACRGDGGRREDELAGAVAGRRWGVALTEDPRGHDAYAVAATASPDGGGFALSGIKIFVPSAHELDAVIVPARTAPRNDADPAGGIAFFVVDPKAAKVAVRDIGVRVLTGREPQAITGDVFCELVLEGVKVGADARLGDAAVGDLLGTALTRMLLMLAATAVGWGDHAIAKGVDYANQRVLYSEPISAYQAIQHPMVRAQTEVEMAKLLIERAVTAAAEGADAAAMALYAGLAKASAVEAAVAAFDISMQAHGGSSFDRETGLITIWPLVLLARPLLLHADVVLERYGGQLLAAS